MKHKNVIQRIVFVALSALLAVAVLPAVARADTQLPTAVDASYYSLVKNVYMAPTGDGYMRLAYDGNALQAEYYDGGFQLKSKRTIGLELPVWGGFYRANDGSYYLVEGQKNTNGVDGTEVVRIIKYDVNWNRLGSGSIYAKEGWEYEIRYPFDISCVNMTEANGKLFVATGREGYVDPQYGMGHQGMMLISMDESSFSTEIVYGDFGHSFSQYVASHGNDVYIYEESEGSRATTLSRYDAAGTHRGYFDAIKDGIHVLDYGGERTSAWAIATYATADGLVSTQSGLLGIGTSIDQDKYDNGNNEPYNIYVTFTPYGYSDANSTTFRWLTSYKKEDASLGGVKLTQIDSNRYLVTWQTASGSSNILEDVNDPLSGPTLHYVFLDGRGNKVSGEYTARATISDCDPIVVGGKALFTSCNKQGVDFYAIDVNTGSFGKTVYRIAGAKATWSINGGSSLYRVYNPATGEHLYTSDTNETQVMATQWGWVFDFSGNPAFYGADKSSGKPFYRILNREASNYAHLFTGDSNERNHWLATGTWNDEGIAWYVL